MVNALELSEELKARTDFSERDARGIVYAISRAIETTAAKLVTSDQFDARMAELRAEMAELRGELRSEMADLRGELRSEMADLRGELRSEMVELRSGLRSEMAELRSEVRGEIANLRIEMHQALRAQTIWLSSTMIAVAGVMIAAIKFIP